MNDISICEFLYIASTVGGPGLLPPLQRPGKCF